MGFSRVLLVCLPVLAALPALAIDIHGTIVDAAGMPVVGAKIRSLSMNRDEPRRGGKGLAATTDATGGFVLRNALTPPSGQNPVRMMVRMADGRFSFAELTEEGGKAKVASESVRIKLLLKDLKGNAVPGIKISLSSLSAVNAGDGGYFAVWSSRDGELTATSDGTGYATFEGLPGKAAVNFQVSQKGFAAIAPPILLPESGDLTESIVVSKSATLSGYVFQDGKPVGGVSVSALSIHLSRGVRTVAQTDATGRYRLENVMPGSVTLTAQTSRSRSDSLLAKPYRDLFVAEGSDLDGLNFALEKGFVLSGRVLTTKSNKPVPGAQVSVRGDSEMTTITDADGKFSARVIEGDYLVVVNEVGATRLPNQVFLRGSFTERDNPALELRIPDFVLLPPITNLTGTVVDSAGKPVGGATVWNLRSSSKAVTNPEGVFKFENKSNAGDLILAQKGIDVTTSASEVGEAVNLVLVLNGKTSSLTGKVVDQDGKPVGKVEISFSTLMSHGMGPGQRVETDDEGAYRIDGVFPGVNKAFIWTKKFGYGPKTLQDITIHPGETKALPSIVIGLADGVIEGTVLDHEGKPAKGIEVSCQVQGVPTAPTDSKGRFRLTGVPRGKHFLVTYNPFGSSEAKTGDKNVEIRMQPPSSQPPGVIQQDRTGQVAPKLDLGAWINGSLDLQKVKGKYLVIDFWATWCGPCIASLPRVQALADKYRTDVAVLGIHTPDADKSKASALLREKGIKYPNAIDRPDKSGIGANHSAFGPKGIPHVFLISPEGKILVDSNDIEDVERELAKLLKK